VRRLDAAIVLVLTAIGLLTLWPQPADEKHRELVPFTDIARSIGHPARLAAVVGNVLVFAVLGWLLARRRLPAVALACALSVSIEIAQLWIPGRTTSVDDVLLNTLGAWLGLRVSDFGARR
jgi:glycopeptide antibiotics resistance protein